MNNYSAIVEDKFKMTRSTARVNVLLDQYEVEQYPILVGLYHQ